MTRLLSRPGGRTRGRSHDQEGTRHTHQIQSSTDGNPYHSAYRFVDDKIFTRLQAIVLLIVAMLITVLIVAGLYLINGWPWWGLLISAIIVFLNVLVIIGGGVQTFNVLRNRWFSEQHEDRCINYMLEHRWTEADLDAVAKRCESTAGFLQVAVIVPALGVSVLVGLAAINGILTTPRAGVVIGMYLAWLFAGCMYYVKQAAINHLLRNAVIELNRRRANREHQDNT